MSGGFDFHGYGYSDRYPASERGAAGEPAALVASSGRERAAREAVVRFILSRHGLRSPAFRSNQPLAWGSMPGTAGRFAGGIQQVDRMVLFGAIARRPPRRYEKPPPAPAWRIVTVEDRNGRALSKTCRPMNSQCYHARILTNGVSAISKQRFRQSQPGPGWGENSDRPMSPTFCTHGTAISPTIRLWYRRGRDHSRRMGRSSLATRTQRSVVQRFHALRPSSVISEISRATHLMHLEAMRYAR